MDVEHLHTGCPEEPIRNSYLLNSAPKGCCCRKLAELQPKLAFQQQQTVISISISFPSCRQTGQSQTRLCNDFVLTDERVRQHFCGLSAAPHSSSLTRVFIRSLISAVLASLQVLSSDWSSSSLISNHINDDTVILVYARLGQARLRAAVSRFDDCIRSLFFYSMFLLVLGL